MGLVQLFREVPCPDILARHLLDRELMDWRLTAQRYLLHLVLSRAAARRHGKSAADVEQFDNKIEEHLMHEQIPTRWGLDSLFSEAGYAAYGPGIFPCWAVALIRLCTLERYWCEILHGSQPEDPYRLPGFHSDKQRWSTDWLEDFRRAWTTELQHVYPELGTYLH